MKEQFHWRHARDSLLTPKAIQLFQILASKQGQQFNDIKDLIDDEYAIATGKVAGEDRRNGGKIQTALSVYREAGWVTLRDEAGKNKVIEITEAGNQALVLLGKVPDFMKAVPYFVLQILSRYQLNNPARPSTSKNPEYDKKLAGSDIFPYWTLFRIMRSCNDRVTAAELRRFVFQLEKHDDISDAIEQILKFRADVESGVDDTELDARYPAPLPGANGEPKYLMGRLGTQVGNNPPVISKAGSSTYLINPAYQAFVDELLSSEPVFEEYLSEDAWMAVHGREVNLEERSEESSLMAGENSDDAGCEFEDEIEEDLLKDDDPIWLQLEELLKHNANGVLLSGPPGTSKSWYASKLALKVTGGVKKQIRHIQFHPSYSYEEFVEGYVPVPSTSGSSPSFEVKPKIFLKLCETAIKHPERLFVLVIDEFSRGDPSRVFGELLTYIEVDYREKTFLLPYSGMSSRVPKNILIIGTMNPHDKSVSDLDDAMERRFSRIAMEPDVDLLRKFLEANNADGEFIGKIIRLFALINEKSPHGFGHTFFANLKDENDLQRLWRHSLKFVFEKMLPFESETVKMLEIEIDKICNGVEPAEK